MQNNYTKPKHRRPSSTLDILGLNQTRHVPQRWAGHYETLTSLREKLTGDRATRSLDAREEIPSFSEHMADAATDSYDRDWALAMASSNQALLYEIDQAVNRIFSGHYGVCEITGEAIEAERLRAIPWTRFSTTAQAALEERGAVHRPHLGELGTYNRNEAVEADEVEDDAEAEKSKK
jgi:RNA polymerase-binding transcription factor DksA